MYGRLAWDGADPAVENWLRDQVVLAWLKRRDPVRFINSSATHFDADAPHSQADRAALMVATAFRHKQTVDSGALDPELLGMSVCKYFWNMLYNTRQDLDSELTRQLK